MDSSEQAIAIAQMSEQLKHISESVNEHRTEHRQDNEAIRFLVTGGFDKMDAKVKGVEETVVKHESSIAILKRDHNWMKGIFTAFWLGFVTWFKFGPKR